MASFLARLEYQNLMNIKLGVADQRFGAGTAYISTPDPNPADYSHVNVLGIPYHHYTAHPPTGFTPTRYEWVAVPDDLSRYPTQNYYGFNRRVVEQLSRSTLYFGLEFAQET